MRTKNGDEDNPPLKIVEPTNLKFLHKTPAQKADKPFYQEYFN